MLNVQATESRPARRCQRSDGTMVGCLAALQAQSGSRLTGFYVVCTACYSWRCSPISSPTTNLYYLDYKGKSYFPILRSYLVGAKLGQWPAELLNVDFKKLEGANALFPPIPYRPSNINLLEPLEPPSAKHWFGTDKLGRDVTGGHDSRLAHFALDRLCRGRHRALDRCCPRRHRRLFRLVDRPGDLADVRDHAFDSDLFFADHHRGAVAAEHLF